MVRISFNVTAALVLIFSSICHGQMSPEEAKAQLEKSETTSSPADNTAVIAALRSQVAELKATVTEQDREIRMLKVRLAKYEPPVAEKQAAINGGIPSLADVLSRMPPAMKAMPMPLNGVASQQHTKWLNDQMVGKIISVDAGFGSIRNGKEGAFVHTFTAEQSQLPSHEFDIDAAIKKEQVDQFASVAKKTLIRITGKVSEVKLIRNGTPLYVIHFSDSTVELLADAPK